MERRCLSNASPSRTQQCLLGSFLSCMHNQEANDNIVKPFIFLIFVNLLFTPNNTSSRCMHTCSSLSFILPNFGFYCLI